MDAPRHRRAALLLAGLALTVSARPDTEATSSVAASPLPGVETYQGYPPAGDGGDRALNLLKNRSDTGRWRATSLPALLSLAWPRAVEKARRVDWAPEDPARVSQNEGRPIEERVPCSQAAQLIVLGPVLILRLLPCLLMVCPPRLSQHAPVVSVPQQRWWGGAWWRAPHILQGCARCLTSCS